MIYYTTRTTFLACVHTQNRQRKLFSSKWRQQLAHTCSILHDQNIASPVSMACLQIHLYRPRGSGSVVLSSYSPFSFAAATSFWKHASHVVTISRKHLPSARGRVFLRACRQHRRKCQSELHLGTPASVTVRVIARHTSQSHATASLYFRIWS